MGGYVFKAIENHGDASSRNGTATARDSAEIIIVVRMQ
jgi:hypothetical protein